MKKQFLIFLLVFLGAFSYVQAQTVTGTVTGAEDGIPIPGATVSVEGFASSGSLTDDAGNFSVELPQGATTLVFSFIGMETQRVAINGQTVINVQLKSESTDIEEVIVVGYGTQKKSLVTGSIAKVDGEEITKGVNLRVNEALQGKTAGVVVTSNSGQPGSFVSIRIRGVGTNGSAEPLYIVDGLPMNGNGIDFINPSDVASIEVLKDAAAASIYGARGANGVVLITTKKGSKTEKFQITYDGYYGLQNPWRKLDVLNTDEYVMIMNEAAANAGQPAKFNQAQIDTLSNTDWQDQMFYYDAPIMNHVLSFSGGNETSTYASSLSLLEQDGIVAKGYSNFKRITYRLNATKNFGFLELGTMFNLVNINNKGIDPNNKFGGNSLIQALNTPPILPVTYSDGTFATPTQYGVGIQEITNPLAVLHYSNNATKTSKLVGNLTATFDFGDLLPALKGLTYRASFGTEVAYVQNNGYTPEYYIDAMHYSDYSRISMSVDKYTTWNLENVLTYDKVFGDNHITGMLGHTAFKSTYQNIGGSKDDFIFDSFDNAYIDNATNTESAIVYGGYGEHTILSYFGRVNYDYAGKYMLTATLRMDGSSRFGNENKFGYFPSVSAGWILSNESFFDNLPDFFNFAKLRLSWGQNGNEEIGDFKYTSVMGNGSIYFFGAGQTQYNGVVPIAIANPSLRWETSEQTDFGLDFGFLNNSLTLNMDYYIKTTKDWLVQAPAPLLVGNVPPTINGGSVRNKGFEAELGYKKAIGDFHFNFSFTGAVNENEVLEIRNQEKKLQGGDGGMGQSGILYAAEGTPLGVFYGIQTDGLFQNQAEIDAHAKEGTLIQPLAKPGDVRFIDENGDGKIDDLDRVILGDPYPDFTGGFNFSLDWKGFDLNMFFYTALGHQIWNATRRYDMLYTNYRSSALDRWTGEGTSTTIPRVTFTDDNANAKTPSDLFVEDADYLRLRNLSFGYTLPSDITKMAKISKVRFYISAENLITLTKYTGYDPEIGGGVFSNGIDYGIYPQARSVLGGINITF